MACAPILEPDTKDWTWVLTRPCPDCGFEAATTGVAEVATQIRTNAAAWAVLLHDAVWASASLLHVARGDLLLVVRRLATATREGGLLRMSVKEGDGEGWSTHGSITLPRMFVYWREAPLRAVLEEAGWQVESVGHGDGLRGERWLGLLARRRESLP